MIKQTIGGEIERGRIRDDSDKVDYRTWYDYQKGGSDNRDSERELTLLGFHGRSRGEVLYQALIIEPSRKCVGAYERIGIVMWSESRDNRLFEGIEPSEVTIV